MWLIERHQIRADSKSSIKNDPNDWSTEHGEPRYIIDLAKRVTTVNMETTKIVRNLPELNL